MKSLLLVGALVFSSCANPRLSVRVCDTHDRPIVGFPIEISAEEGVQLLEKVHIRPSVSRAQTIKNTGENSYKMTTDSNGEAVIFYRFSKSQPSLARILLGVKLLPDGEFNIKPLRELPKQASIKLYVPNP